MLRVCLYHTFIGIFTFFSFLYFCLPHLILYPFYTTISGWFVTFIKLTLRLSYYRTLLFIFSLCVCSPFSFFFFHHRCSHVWSELEKLWLELPHPIFFFKFWQKFNYQTGSIIIFHHWQVNHKIVKILFRFSKNSLVQLIPFDFLLINDTQTKTKLFQKMYFASNSTTVIFIKLSCVTKWFQPVLWNNIPRLKWLKPLKKYS